MRLIRRGGGRNISWLADGIPTLLLHPYEVVRGVVVFAPHLAASIAARVAILLPFPLAAQWFLTQAEV